MHSDRRVLDEDGQRSPISIAGLQVGADAKELARRIDQHTANGGVLVALRGNPAQFSAESQIHRIPAFGLVQRDVCDALIEKTAS